MYPAEVTSIQEAMTHIEIIKPNTRDINLFSDSKAALKALDACADNSKTIMECCRSLNETDMHYKIMGCWTSAHRG